MSGLGDDLQKAKVGFLQVLEGASQFEQAATSVLQKVDAIAGHMTEAGTLERVAAAGLEAVLEATGREVQAAVVKPRPASPTPRNVLRCRRHGEQRWQQTIVCTACGRVFQLLNASTAHYAPAVCPCGVQLLPEPHVMQYSAAAICTSCFTGIAATGGRAVRRTP